MTRSLRSSGRDVRVLLQKLQALRSDAAARQQAAADERRLLEQSLGQVEALEIQVGPICMADDASVGAAAFIGIR